MPPESSFQPQEGLISSILLHDAQIPQKAKDKLSSLLEKDYDSIVSKSPIDVGRTNLFSNWYSNKRPTHSMQTIPNSINIQNACGQRNNVTGKSRRHIKMCRPMSSPSHYSTQNPRPLKSSETTASLMF